MNENVYPFSGADPATRPGEPAFLSNSGEGLESYAHRGAKSLLTQWLRAAAARAGIDNYANFSGLEWRVNRGAPHYGVWEEYPVLSDGVALDCAWDEAAAGRWRDRPPSYEELVADGSRPTCILDIAVQHKGSITFGIEVVHKHACDPRKVGFLRKLGFSVLEIPSYWALGQVDVPKEIPPEFVLTFSPWLDHVS